VHCRFGLLFDQIFKIFLYTATDHHQIFHYYNVFHRTFRAPQLTLSLKHTETASEWDNDTLVKTALSGGPQAFGPIIERYKDAVFGVALSRLRNFHDAEDMTQSAFVEAFDRLPSLKDPKRLGAWLRSITLHKCINYQKRESRSTTLDAIAEPISQAPNPQHLIEREELRTQVMQAIDQLSKVQRETVTLYYISGYSQQEVAQIQEVPLGTIKRRLHEARNKLKEDMLYMVEDVLKDGAPDENFANRVFELLNAYPNRQNLWQRDIRTEIEKIGPSGISGFQKAFQQPHWQTRRAVVSYIHNGLPTEETITLLKQALKDPNKKVRKHAIDELLDIDVSEERKREEFIPLISELLFDHSKMVRRVFANIWPIKKYLADFSPEIVAKAIEQETDHHIQQRYQLLLLRILNSRREQKST
jgi:RNA polymerase sigma-70 factor (ECF subfamily)